MKRPFESIFTDRLGIWAIGTPRGAFVAGIAATFLAFVYLSVLWDAYEAFGVFGAVGTLIMWVLIFLFASGMLLSKIPWVYDRVCKVIATLYISGSDEEQVDRNIITVRSMGEQHGLKVVHEETIRGDDVPPELQHLKHRLVSVRGTIHKMRAFNADANEFLAKDGIHIFTSGDAAHEIEGEGS